MYIIDGVFNSCQLHNVDIQMIDSTDMHCIIHLMFNITSSPRHPSLASCATRLCSTSFSSAFGPGHSSTYFHLLEHGGKSQPSDGGKMVAFDQMQQPQELA